MRDGKSILAMMLTGVGSEAFIASAFSFSLSRRAKVTDNVLNVNVNEHRFNLGTKEEYIHVKGYVQRTQSMGEVTSRHQETCPFGDTVNY